ncbi:condensation domain-containing protein, partial [Streptomyces albipurpureus]
LDHTQLPTPTTPTTQPTRPPRGEQEIRIARVFTDVLGLESVGADDDFFVLGGHSLLATQVVARIRALGAECSIRDVFEAKTVAGLSARLTERATIQRPQLTDVVRPTRLPLSFAQQRLWFLDQMEGPGDTYNLPFATRLRGPLDVTALESALADVVARHESLRTRFDVQGGEPSQRVLHPADVQVPFTVVDVPEEWLAETVETAAGELFHLAEDLPLRVTLLKVADDDHVLMVLMHHIATDEWSMGPLLTDLDTAYAARTAGRAPDFTPLPVQYADFALWQRQLLGNPDDPTSLTTRQTTHWRTTLADLPDEIPLPTDRPRPPVPSHRGDTVEVPLAADLVAGLDRLAQDSGATMFMVVHAAVAALLHRLGAGDDIPLGSPVAGRGDEALDDLVGFFVNTVVLRTDLSGIPTFAELLDRVLETDLSALDHIDLPFDSVVEAVNPERSLTRHPLFQTMVAYEGGGPDLTRLFNTAAEEHRIHSGAAKFDLDILFRRLPKGIGTDEMTCGVRFATDLFDRGTVEALADRLLRLLAQAVAEPDRPIADLELLSADEHAQLAQWNTTERPVPNETIIDILARQVTATPDETAVVAGETHLTFTQLATASDQLAHLLITEGIGPD